MSGRRCGLKESLSRVQTLCRLSPSSIASAQCLKLNSGRYITVLSTGSKLLHIIQKHKVHCVINVGSPILKVLDYVNERDEIWVLTNDGKLCAIPIPPEKAKEQDDELKTEKASPNHEIFTELLGDDEHPHPLVNQTCNGSPFTHVHECSEDIVRYWEPGLQNVAIGTHHVITCSINECDVTLTVYPWLSQQDHAGRNEISPNFLHQSGLPKDDCHYSSTNVVALLYVSPGEHHLSKSANSTLDQQFFRLLFHSQSEGNFPVVLVGLSTGFVGYILVGPKNSKLEALYHIEQPVISILVVCLKPPLPKEVNQEVTPTGDAVVILGALGKLVVITQDNSRKLPNGIFIQENHVPGPIICAAMSNKFNLFYSTLKEIYVVPLEFSSGDTSTSLCPLPPSLSPTTLYIPKVLALAIEISDDSYSIICLKSDGHLLLFAKLPTDVASKSAEPITSSRQIEKHLNEIREKACHVKQLGEEICQLDALIKQLNNVTQVLCEILRNRASQTDQTLQESCSGGISFKVDVDYEAQGTSLEPRVILKCVLKNSTRLSFSKDWSLVVQVVTIEPWFNENNSTQMTRSHSVSLSSALLHHISIPMEDCFSYLTPVQVSCYICFGIKELLPVFLRDCNRGLIEQGFTVLVSTTELDILHFLRLQEKTSIPQAHDYKHPVHLLQNATFEHEVVLEDDTQIMEENAPERKTVEEESPEFSMFSMHVSKEANDFIRKILTDLNESDGEGKDERKLASRQACLLQYILHHSRKHLCHAQYEDAHVLTRTPCEEMVKFQVLLLDQVGTLSSMEGLEVRVHTSSQALGCAVHSALLKLLKPVVQRTFELSGVVPVGELQKQLIKLKELQTSLDLLQPLQLSKETNEASRKANDATIKRLISIYWELRKIPTTIP